MSALADLNICFLAGTLGQGGAERQLFLLCRLLVDAGAQVRVLSLSKNEFWEEPIRELGVPVIWVGQKSSKPARLWAIRQQLKRWRPAICQSQHFFTNLYAYLACKGLGIKDLGAIRSNTHLEMASHNQYLAQWSLKWPSLILANSKQAIAAARQYGRHSKPMAYLPNIIHAGEFPRVKPAVKDRYRILGVGRLIRLKHWPTFLRVIAELSHDGFPVEGVLVGDGPQRKQLEALAAKLNLQQADLQFVGAVDDVGPLYASADLLLATSSLEGMPNVVMEAMACGLPVVSTRVGGVPDLIEHGEHGYLAEVDGCASLREHCSKLLSDLALRRQIGQAARAFIDQHHAPNAVLAYLELLYKDILA